MSFLSPDERVLVGLQVLANHITPSDLAAQLVRVDERIANQILPDMFVQRKQMLLIRKAAEE
jgi:hypothetical protein